jgi:hypothetical protein
MGVGHALLGLDWSQQGVPVSMGVITGSLLAVIGCALALASDLNRRRYRSVGPAASER